MTVIEDPILASIHQASAPKKRKKEIFTGLKKNFLPKFKHFVSEVKMLGHEFEVYMLDSQDLAYHEDNFMEHLYEVELNTHKTITKRLRL